MNSVSQILRHGGGEDNQQQQQKTSLDHGAVNCLWWQEVFPFLRRERTKSVFDFPSSRGQEVFGKIKGKEVAKQKQKTRKERRITGEREDRSRHLV